MEISKCFSGKNCCVFWCCYANRFSYSAFVFFQASAALARKKAKLLHKDIVTFWQKKKTSKFVFPDMIPVRYINGLASALFLFPDVLRLIQRCSPQ